MADHWEVETVRITVSSTQSVKEVVNYWLYKNPGYNPMSYDFDNNTGTVLIKSKRRVVN